MKLIKLSLVLGMMLATATCGFAQRTAAELKAEREQLAQEMKSKDFKNAEKKFNKMAPVSGTMADFVNDLLQPLPAELASKVGTPLKKLVGDKPARLIEKPAPTNLNSVDALINISSSLLGIVTATNAILTEYRTEIADNGNGEVDITKYTAKLDDYMAVMPLLAQAGIDIAKATKQIPSVPADIQTLGPAQAMPVTKSFNWAKDAVTVCGTLIATNTKLLQNLIESAKAAKNL